MSACRSLPFVIVALVLACGGAPTGPPPGPVSAAYDIYRSGPWAYRYAAPGYSEGLDSVAGALDLALQRAPGDTARVTAADAAPVVGYFWAKTDAAADTVRGRGLIWAGAATLTARYAVDTAGYVHFRAPQPATTFLTHVASTTRRLDADRVRYALALTSPDSQTTVRLTIDLFRRP